MKLLLLICLFTSVLGCGIRLPKPISRHARAIIGGKNVTTPDKWPWQVLLRANINEDNESSCGGTVIANQWILTAAHCVKNSSISAIAVFDGITHFDESETLMANSRKVIEMEVHSDYDPVTSSNDIAVLKRTLVACKYYRGNYRENRLCQLVRPWYPQSDSGGPLMMRDSSGRWFQIGITSFAYCVSDGCEAPGDAVRGDLFPTFTAVRPYCDWIALSTGGAANCYDSEVLLEDVGIKERTMLLVHACQ